MTFVRAHVWITGRVQGVGFRYHTMLEAERLGVHGWVRNLMDGRVEAVAEGAPEGVQMLIKWCQHGPRAARVENVEVAWEGFEGASKGFHIRPMA